MCQLCLWHNISHIELMRPDYHLFRQEQPDVFHQMSQKGLISLTIGRCYNC